MVEESITAAAEEVAQALGGDVKKTEAELLSKVLGKIDQTSTSLSDLILGMKVDRTKEHDEGLTISNRGQQVKNLLVKSKTRSHDTRYAQRKERGATSKEARENKRYTYLDHEINKIHRIGSKNKENKKPRPLLCALVNNWRKAEIMKNKRKLKEINISEDYSKEVLEKRKSILEAEVEKAIDTQSISKTPGPDGINNEVLKQGKEILIPVLTDMFNDFIDTEIMPQQWTEFNIILLYKKGDKHEIGNYCPISLMSNIYKVFAKIMTIEQAGFPKNYSVDHIHTVCQIIVKYNEYQLTYYIAFTDYSKAFDSLLHKNIWGTLVEQEVEYKYIRLSKNVYNHSTARIQLEKKGIPFKVGRLDWEELGINIDGTLLTHLRFADDIMLFAKTPEYITRMIEDLAIESERVGVKLNPEKNESDDKGTHDRD
ncbi:LINE-1 reverse transcriptase homolog [Eumeta japonica]|uniref:LINE-1 reverse transcriptase homolog n=1 Tax=Eumeta variegata TaxID=151549 RepID=A0A4C1SBR1_EUMVA|nr:LINE-1 reverse transcriptase homolog [Eumeta japonica]